jgi:hypothetical protein
MLSRVRPRLTYANVVATICLFLILGGAGAYAANEWTGTNIVDGSLTGADIQDLSLGLPDYGANSISTGKLKDQDVRTADLRDLGVTNPKIAWDSVSSGKVIDNNLTGNDINESTLAVVRKPLVTRTGIGTTLAPGQSRLASGYCEAGETLVSGGPRWSTAPAGSMVTLDSYPSVPPTGWHVEVFNGTSTDKTITVRVVCAP